MRYVFRSYKSRKALYFVSIFILLVSTLAGCRTVADSVLSGVEAAEAAATPLANIFDLHTIRIAVGEWAPYTGAALPHYGCDAWVVSEAFELRGYTVEYGFYPWARSYLLSETGEWDGTMEWDDTPEHRQGHYFSSEYVSDQEWVFFYRSDRSFDWHTLDDLKGKVVGITSGYVYSDAFNELIDSKTVSFEEAGSDEANMKKLLLGRVDVFPVERRVGYAILQGFSEDERAMISDHPTSFHEFHPYVLLSKAIPQNERRIKEFDNGLQELKESGRYDEIMEGCLPQK